MSRAITQRDRKVRIRAHARAGARRYGRETLDTVAWWKSRRHYVAPAPYVTAKVQDKYTETPPPKYLEVEPGSQDDVYNNFWMM